MKIEKLFYNNITHSIERIFTEKCKYFIRIATATPKK